METLNGAWVVFAEKSDGDDRIILAVRADELSPTHFEYVTAAADSRDKEPNSWYWGHYFRELDAAVQDFRER